MKIEHDCDLSKYTTLHIGGKCKTMYFPQSIDDLQQLMQSGKHLRILGGGSNLLINDRIEFDEIICMRRFLSDTLLIEDNRVTVGSGVRLQKLITTINENGLGGIEYLFSVPGLVGGAIIMNAGRGRGANKQISDYLVSVDVMEDGEIKTYIKEECKFDYRKSVFQSKKCIILKAIFEFDRISPEDGKRLQKERIETCKQFQDNKYPNAGTTFCQSNARIMNWIKKHTDKKATQGVHFSACSANWLQNRGSGTYDQAIKKIKRVMMLHRILNKQCAVEYVIWR